MHQRTTQSKTTPMAFTRVDCGFLWSRRAQIQCNVCLRSLGWCDTFCHPHECGDGSITSYRTVGSLWDVCLSCLQVCLRDARLERLAERLCPFERPTPPPEPRFEHSPTLAGLELPRSLPPSLSTCFPPTHLLQTRTDELGNANQVVLPHQGLNCLWPTN